jgi:hypothetical protein
MLTAGEATLSDANEVELMLGGSSDVLDKRSVVPDSLLTASSAMFT